jgi:hypothetical protein
MVVAPVLVTAGVPARTAKGAAVPSPTGAGAAETTGAAARVLMASVTAMPTQSGKLAA